MSNSSSLLTSIKLRLSLELALIAYLLGALTRVALYLRPTPYGGPFVAHIDRFLFHALFYGLLGPALIAAPFALYYALRGERDTPRWPLVVQALLLGLSLFFDQLDHEVMRYMGVHATPSLLLTFKLVGDATSTGMRSFSADEGGPWSSVWVTALALGGFAGLAWWRLRRGQRGLRRWWALGLLALPLLAVGIAIATPGGKFRMTKVQPYLMTLYDALLEDWSLGEPPADLERLVREQRALWSSESAEDGWTFPDPSRPLIRRPAVLKPKSDDPWNVVLIHLETLRARDLGSPDVTPFLTGLMRQGKAAWWPRAMSFGPPTINAFIAAHCSAPPHSERNIAAQFTYVDLLCLPQVLRAAGYRAEFFTGSDPDWDGQSAWLKRWYDEHTFYRDAEEQDRVVFQRAAARIAELAKRPEPFLATVVSISNHYPFDSRDSSLDIAGHEQVEDRLKNTLHYTDAVLAEFVAALEKTPTYSRTLIVVYGDHGYNLGEHTEAGQRNGYEESTRVGLLILGAHPKLKMGRHDEIASHLDLVPTILELLGIQVENPWLGHSLLHFVPRTFLHRRGGVTFAVTPTHSFVALPEAGGAELFFEASDLLQTRPVAPPSGDAAAALLKQMDDQSRLWDYLVESNQVFFPAGEAR